MKGLIVKDLKLIGKIGKMYFIILAVLILLSFIGYGMGFLSLYAILFTSILAPNTVAYDERDRWDKFALTLPISKAQYVSSKYLLSLLLSFCAVLLSSVALIKSDGFTVNSLIIFIMYIVISMLYPAISLPVSMGFGYAKSKLPLTIFAGIIGGISVIISRLESVYAYIYSMNKYIVFVIFLAAVIVFALSWLIAVKLYKRREL